MGWTGHSESTVSYYSLPESPLPISILANKQSSVVGMLEWARRFEGFCSFWVFLSALGSQPSVFKHSQHLRVPLDPRQHTEQVRHWYTSPHPHP